MGIFRRVVLDNGTRILLERLPECPSVAFSVTVAQGSRREPAELNGISHFIEHMLFKGTPRRDLYQIAREINLQGGMMNASTNSDSVRVYTRVVAEDMADAVDLIHDMMWNSHFPAEEVERERGVILEEIAEYNDAPEDLCYENFLAQLWMPHPLGRPVIGTPETVGAMTREVLLAYWAEIKHPRNVIVSMAGGIDLDEAEALLRRKFEYPAPAPVSDPETVRATGSPGRIAVERDLEQVQFCLGMEAIHRHDERRYPFAMLDIILGGGMGSRLFNEIREKRGLAYTIASSASMAMTEGYFVVYGATTPANIDRVLDVCRSEMKLIAADGPTEDELETAKRQIVRGHLLSQESSVYFSARNCDREMYNEPRLEDAEIIARLRAVTSEQVAGIARTVFEREATLSLVGPLEE